MTEMHQTPSPQPRDEPRSALVDVPAVESEPVAWTSQDQLDDANSSGLGYLYAGEWKPTKATIPVYAHPPRSLSNEGSEIAEKGVALAAAFIANYSRMEDGDGNEAPELALARDILALSTRKGSAGDGAATGTKGCADE